jgi:hypothetical protein
MKLSQSRYHFIAKRALTTPGLRRVAQSRLVDLHVDVFTDWSAPGRAAERQRYLSALSDALVDAYREGIEAGRPEAGARERVHVMANLAFHERGWTELLEFPPSEFGPHLERHREFRALHDGSPADPTGDFRSAPLPPAPATPERAACGVGAGERRRRPPRVGDPGHGVLARLLRLLRAERDERGGPGDARPSRRPGRGRPGTRM